MGVSAPSYLPWIEQTWPQPPQHTYQPHPTNLTPRVLIEHGLLLVGMLVALLVDPVPSSVKVGRRANHISALPRVPATSSLSKDSGPPLGSHAPPPRKTDVYTKPTQPNPTTITPRHIPPLHPHPSRSSNRLIVRVASTSSTRRHASTR